jgi:hypothetical protein
MTQSDKDTYAKNVLNTLQNLSNDKLRLERNKVVIDQKSDGNQKQNATNLIRGFIEGNDKHKQDVTFEQNVPILKNSASVKEFHYNNENGKFKSSIIAYDFKSIDGRGYYENNTDTKEQKKMANHETSILYELVHSERTATNSKGVGDCNNCVRGNIPNEEAQTQTIIRNIYQPENPSFIKLTKNPYKNDKK